MDPIDKILSRALDTSMAKQSAIASNIANVDTPGYQRQDVNFENEMEKILMGEGENESSQPEVIIQQGQPVKLENEIMEISKNTGMYTSLAKITALRMRILEASIGGGN
jgi:flagellar basal-body rod protein FlgB